MSNKSKLPILKDLVDNISLYEKSDELNFLLNQEPPKSWVKEHPYIRGHKYVPIDKVEYLLRKIFKKYRIEILREGTSFNGVFVVVRVNYLNPISNEWDYHDGIGAINLQLRKQTKQEKENDIKVDFNTVNINNGALSMAFPLAKTLAIKDACDMFGKLFGSDLNRRDSLPASMDVKSKNVEMERIKESIEKCETEYELNEINRQLVVNNIGGEEVLLFIKNQRKKINKK